MDYDTVHASVVRWLLVDVGLARDRVSGDSVFFHVHELSRSVTPCYIFHPEQLKQGALEEDICGASEQTVCNR